MGTVAASDPDVNDVLTYWITAGNVGGTFAIGGLTGQLTVNTPPGLDFETRAEFTLTVEVKDRRGLTASARVTIYVNDLNDPPTLDAIADRAVDKDAGEQLVALTGISDGDDGTQPLAVTAVSSNPALIPHPLVEYTDGSDSGVLQFSPAAGRSGTALITVTVTDGGLDKDLATAEDNATFSRTFQVVVNDNDVYISPIPDPASIERNAPQQTVIVTGIASGRGPSQPLAVTARSDRKDIIPSPAVSYTSPDSIAVLTYQPLQDAHGTAVTDRVVGQWSCEPVRGRAAEVSGVTEFDPLLFVHEQPLEAREILPFFNSATDLTEPSDGLEDVLSEIVPDIAEAFLAL